MAYADGSGQLSSPGHSIHYIKCSGQLISNLDGNNTSADKQLWSQVVGMMQNEVKSDEVATLTLKLQTGDLVLTGWMLDHADTRRAPDGISKIDITVNFLIKTINHSGLS